MGTALVDHHRISSDLVRQALGRFATGVTVVTTRGSDGVPVGTTASAVSSVSLVPPLLLVCLGTVAVLDCRLERSLDGGDHEIVIGRLVAVARSDQDLRPLVHYQGSYASLRAV